MSITRRTFLFSTAALASCAGSSHAADGLRILGGQAFGSRWRMVLADGSLAGVARAAVTRLVDETDASMSPYRSGSELSRFNRERSTGWFHASPELRAVASEALAISRLTDGAFDPTVGPLVARYGFGPISGGRGRPVDLKTGVAGLRKRRSDLTLDLCGIAKGHALDRIIDNLSALGVTSALVEVGGEVRCIGTHPSGRTWRVGVERPDSAAGAVQRVIAPGSLALATSGSGRQGVEVGSRSFSHLIDPRAGRTIGGAPASVSVLSRTAMRADALATALMVMGPRKGRDFARDHGISALFAHFDGGKWRDAMTGNFERHVVM